MDVIYTKIWDVVKIGDEIYLNLSQIEDCDTIEFGGSGWTSVPADTSVEDILEDSDIDVMHGLHFDEIENEDLKKVITEAVRVLSERDESRMWEGALLLKRTELEELVGEDIEKLVDRFGGYLPLPGDDMGRVYFPFSKILDGVVFEPYSRSVGRKE